jgi:polar amino acid transport system substrate-binding protein
MLRKLIQYLLIISLLVIPSLQDSEVVFGAELSEIQKRGKLIVGVKDNLRPLGFRDENGELQGLEIDLARALAAELLGDANAVILKPISNQDRIKILLENEVDLVIARMTVTSSRSRIVDFSRYYYLDGTGIITKNTNINQLKDLEQKNIAVLQGSNTIAVIRNIIPNSKLIAVESYQEAFYLLETGGADAFSADNTVLVGWQQENPQYKMLPVRLSGEALSIAMPRGLQYNQLQQRVNSAIARWRESGWLQERINYWGLPE